MALLPRCCCGLGPSFSSGLTGRLAAPAKYFHTFQRLICKKIGHPQTCSIQAHPLALKKMDTSRWICLYPSYLDSAKTIDKGRKIAKAKAVDAPHAEEIYATVRFMGFEAVLEKKYYSKSFHYSTDLYLRGRIRVKLFDENKKSIRPEIGSRKLIDSGTTGRNGRALFVQVATNIPKYREKHGRKVDQLSQMMTAPAAAPAGGSRKTGKSTKKGGKKKK